MTSQAKRIVVGLLIVATAFEVSGDAIVRLGLGSRTIATKAGLFIVGAAFLFAYG